MENIIKIKKLSIWIFIIPFVSLNACLIMINNFPQFFAAENVVGHTIPYIDGQVSISRTAIFLVLHTIFLGIKYDYNLYKLFRRILILCFIIFEIGDKVLGGGWIDNKYL